MAEKNRASFTGYFVALSHLSSFNEQCCSLFHKKKLDIQIHYFIRHTLKNVIVSIQSDDHHLYLYSLIVHINIKKPDNPLLLCLFLCPPCKRTKCGLPLTLWSTPSLSPSMSQSHGRTLILSSPLARSCPSLPLVLFAVSGTRRAGARRCLFVFLSSSPCCCRSSSLSLPLSLPPHRWVVCERACESGR